MSTADKCDRGVPLAKKQIGVRLEINASVLRMLRSFKAGVNMNLSEVLTGLKKGWKKENYFGTPPDSLCQRESTPGCQGTVLVYIY